MYSFEPTDEQQMLVEAVGKYAANDLRVAAREAEERGELPKKLVSKGWEIGLLQASIPEAYGGFGERSAVTGVLAVEELAHGCSSAAWVDPASRRGWIDTVRPRALPARTFAAGAADGGCRRAVAGSCGGWIVQPMCLPAGPSTPSRRAR